MAIADAFRHTAALWQLQWVKAVTTFGVMLAILAGWTFLAIESKEVSFRSASLSNMKQVATCFWLYAHDHDQHLPSADNWEPAISPYWGNSMRMRPSQATYYKDGALSFNSLLGGLKLDEINLPSRTPLILEIERPGHSPVANLENPYLRNGRVHVAFVDGNVKSMTPEEYKRVAVINGLNLR